MDIIRKALTQLGAVAAHPLAFLTVAAYALLWWTFSRDTLEWHGFATLATWCMTLFIQRSEYRDTQALHAKLDEMLRAEGRAEKRLMHLDEEEPEEVERHRAEAAKKD